MSVSPKQIGLIRAEADLATGGNVTLPVGGRIEQYRGVTVNQTTASQTVTLPAPVDTSVVFTLFVSNIGTVPFTLYGVALAVASSIPVTWNGTAWTVEPGAAAAAMPTQQALVPTAQNTLPALGAIPRAGMPIFYYVNGVLVNGISNAGTALTVTPATVGYNIETTDEVVAFYYV